MGMRIETRHPLPARLHTLAAMAGLLERLEASPTTADTGASAEQYRSVARCVQTLLQGLLHGTGTNALLVDACVREFAFGVNSLARHVAMAEQRGKRALTCAHPALAFDLDTTEDLAEWMRYGDALPPFLAAPPVPA